MLDLLYSMQINTSDFCAIRKEYAHEDDEYLLYMLENDLKKDKK